MRFSQLTPPTPTAAAPAGYPPSQALLRRQRGFSLVEMALVLAIVGLLGALFLPATNTMLDNNRRKETRAKLEAVQMALTRFVMTTQRLPCPADGALLPTNASYGLEQRTGEVCDVMIRGVAPWRTLGLGVNEAVDAWGTLLTYRVWAKSVVASTISTSLTMNNGMNMSTCDPAQPGPAIAPSYLCGPAVRPLSVLTADNTLAQARGFRACNSAPACTVTVLSDPPNTNELARRVDGNGVAYFLISHGANKVHGYTSGGVFVTTASGAGPGPREDINRNNLALRSASPDDFYIDADYEENPVDYYDDIVLRPTVIQVAISAGLGPRAP